MNHLFEHTDILLRAMEPEDLDLLYVWENDSDLWRYGTTVSPFSRYIIRQYLSEAHFDIYQTKQLRLMIELRGDSKRCVGMVDLFDFSPNDLRAGVGILIGKEYQRKGFGLQALELLQQYAFGFLHLAQLYAYVPENNTASIRLFSKSGFHQTAILKKWVRAYENYHDVVVFQQFAPEQA